MRKCNCCSKNLPLTTEYYRIKRDGDFGKTCLVCIEKGKAYYAKYSKTEKGKEVLVCKWKRAKERKAVKPKKTRIKMSRENGYEKCRICRKKYLFTEDNFMVKDNKLTKRCVHCTYDSPSYQKYLQKKRAQRSKHVKTEEERQKERAKGARKRERERQRKLLKKENEPKPIPGHKFCNQCGQEKPIDIINFEPRKDESKDGYRSTCRECRGTVLKIPKDFRVDRRRKSDEEIKEQKRVKKQQRKAKEKEVEHTLTTAQWIGIKLAFDNRCAYCGKVKKLTIDHFIPLSKGGELSIDNIIPACVSCNSSKRAEDFITWYPKQSFYNKNSATRILTYLNYDKRGEMQQRRLFN